MPKAKVNGSKGLIGQPPKGFRATAVGGGFGTQHDFGVEPVLQGTCVAVRHKIGKNKQSIMDVKTDKGLRSVWHSAQLDGLFSEAKPGKSQVYIAFQGTQKIKGRKNPMKLFAAYIK